ncbi:uncharacterized protein [Spinacia oleracea]|uniref:Uncharacterized protein n=1 Tax=Spinacia oleracea TaxID=3562 RepID=A0A9R0JPR3_SPIOL|nr:uncharacterized protein LOC110782686 [Spinacia oleracea]
MEEEEDARNFTKTHFFQQRYNAKFQVNPREKGKSCSHFLLKFLFLALFLCLLPLFPSDPPEFISHTVFAKSWELIHLLIIGIALSYGLFCRRKTTQVPPKTQISQPFAPNVLQHSSIFDYEEGNPSGVFDKNVIPTQSFNLSHYRTEPFVELRRENCKVFDEKPLGLPVRSLRSRVVDSDSEEEEEEEEEECASDCDSDSDLSGNNSSNSKSRSGIKENSEGNMEAVRLSDSRPTAMRKSQSARTDFFMEDSDKLQATQLNSEYFRSPAPEASSCQKFSGLCSWLPESPNMERENSWRGNSFYTPFSNFNQVSDFNLVGVSPNLENATNVFMSSAAVPSSVPFSGNDFASGSRTYNYGYEYWGSPNFGKGNLGVDNSGFFMPSPKVRSPMSMSIPGNDLASRSRQYNHGTENWSESPILPNGTLGSGVNNNIFRPSASFPPSVPASADTFASSVIASKIAEFNHGSSLNKMYEMRSENNNMSLSGENRNNFVPSAKFSPSMTDPRDDFPPSVKASKSAKFKKRDEMGTENSNVASGTFQEGTKSYIPHCDVPLSDGESPKLETANLGSHDKPNFFMKTDEVLDPVNELASTSSIFNHEASANKDEERPEGDTVFVDSFSSSTSKVDVSPKKNEQRPIPERWDINCFEIPLSENNDSGDILHPTLPDSPEAPGSGSRISCHQQGSPRNEVEEIVPMNNLEIESVPEDILGENISYKPSIPSPPLQIQTQSKDLVVSSSVESSSRAALGNQSFLSDDDDDQRSPERRKALSTASHSPRFSCGSFFDRDLRKSFKGEGKEVNRKTKAAEHQFARGGKCGWDCLNVKPTMNKASLKGKSVRTVRPKHLQKTDLIELKLEEYNQALSVTNGGDRKGEKPETVVIHIGISENSNRPKGEKLKGIGGTSVVVGLSSKQNSNDKASAVVNDDVKEEVNDSEIDRKADEFIAKFKQQIRLQKVAPRGNSSRQHKRSLYQT